jgi:Ion channel
MTQGEQTGPEARYGLLLITLVASYLLSAVTHSKWAEAVHVGLVVAIALLAVRHAGLRPRGYVLAIVATVVTAAAAAIGATSANAQAEGIASIWNGLVLLLAVVVIINRVVRLEQVTAQSIYAALSTYLLIGLMFASIFGALGYLVTGPFFADGQPVNAQTLQYFSFTTLTTLGYGDFTAAGSLGRALAVLEAMAGQIFLATLVARLVSAYGTTRRRPPPSE